MQGERQVAASLIGRGVDLQLPSLYDLDVALGLIDPPKSDLSPEQQELREALRLNG